MKAMGTDGGYNGVSKRVVRASSVVSLTDLYILPRHSRTFLSGISHSPSRFQLSQE